MKVFYIDLTGLDSKQELRDYLAAKLPLPDYCGSALDSYYDVLTEFGDAAAGTPGLRIRFYP